VARACGNTSDFGSKIETIKSEFGLNTVPKWVLICHPKALAQATGFGFCKPQAGPKANSGQGSGPGLAWLGLASGFKPELAHH